MNNMSLRVTENRLEIVTDTYTTGGSVNYDGCVFDFDSTWNGFIKTAVFGFGNSDCVRVELQNDACKIPAICLKNEGIVRIGVYGINEDEIIITTNCVAHRVQEGVTETGDWVEEDSYFIYEAIKSLEDGVDKYTSGLDKRFEALLKMVRKQGSFSDSGVNPSEPADWYLPAEFTDDANVPSGAKQSEYDEYLDYILNKLAEDFPDYVSVSEIGIDSSGTYPIYAYTFAPIDYEKTVLVSACTAASDAGTFLSLSYFLDELCRNHAESRTLSYFRSKVKLVVLPAVNPYALVKRRPYNANGVEINRNFPYRWSECASRYKGNAPADQNETAAVIEYAELISSDKLCAVLDLKSKDNLYCSKMAFYPRFRSGCAAQLCDTLTKFNYEEDDENNVLLKMIFAPSVNPTLANYLADMYDLNALSLVLTAINYGGAEKNGSITKFAELIGNVLYTLAKNSTYTLNGAKIPFTKHLSWRGGDTEDSFSIPSGNELHQVPITAYEFNLKSPCNITMNGYAIVKVTSACTVKLNPLLWQNDSPEQTLTDRMSMTGFSYELPLTAGTHVLPMNSVLQGYYSDDNGYMVTGYPEKVKFCIAVSASAASSAKLIGFSATFNAFESNLAKPIEITRPMGVSGDYTDEDDVPTQEIIYPVETVRAEDSNYYD